MKLVPSGLAARFSLLLLAALIGGNLFTAFLMAREGSGFDREIRVQGDMGRLVALVTALEEVDAQTAANIVARTSTGFTRFSVDPMPVGPDHHSATMGRIEAEIARVLPGREIRSMDGNQFVANPNVPLLQVVSVQLAEGVHRGQWLNSLVYPLPPSAAWQWKIGFFVPLFASLAATLSVGLLFIGRMTRPMRQLAAAARAAGHGDRSARVKEEGARELRDAAVAFNDMQQRIADFDAERMRLVAAIGHDLRTPITSLRIRAEMSDDEELRVPMIRILDAMAVMTDDLLNYGQAIGEAEEPRDTDLSVLLAHLCEDHGVVFAGADPVRLHLRRVAITRAMGNLVGNAVRYAGSASVRLETSATEAVVIVDDDGPGIEEDVLEASFEPFMRGDDSRNAETGGSGLGLSIARTIVIANGGMVTLANRPEGGLRAELRLPLRRGD